LRDNPSESSSSLTAGTKAVAVFVSLRPLDLIKSVVMRSRRVRGKRGKREA
jgi:hypothetical protein